MKDEYHQMISFYSINTGIWVCFIAMNELYLNCCVLEKLPINTSILRPPYADIRWTYKLHFLWKSEQNNSTNVFTLIIFLNVRFAKNTRENQLRRALLEQTKTILAIMQSKFARPVMCSPNTKEIDPGRDVALLSKRAKEVRNRNFQQ